MSPLGPPRAYPATIICRK